MASLKKDSIYKDAPNRKLRDGRVNLDTETGPGPHGATVSPLNSDFKDQIENGVWPLVSALLDKNYFPIASCHGHPGANDKFHVIFGIPTRHLL